MEVGRGRRGASSHGKLVPIPFSSIKMREGFWSPRQHANRAFGLRHGYEQLHKAGNLLDLRLAAGIESGRYVGKVFMDSDVYKWLEAIAYELFKEDDSDLRRMSDEVIALVEKAQRPDGYINSYFQIAAPERQWKDLSHGHELYCAGHLIEAAIAFKRLLGDLRLFDVAVRFVEHIDNRFGSGKIEGTPGHPEIELALVELYRETGNERYLRLAKYFVDQRGKGL
ncbi:MAG TPA: beta-L-arabinofuranosidase domain-containing protein, partial [Spirochaetia bacterium]|nr:beta-L-arabinofuranosidase domain-containing protein [Spirochaetia bacterium]